MARRTLAWALVTPVSAAGILAAHALAYALTGTEPGAMHGYLAHAPQVVAVLATIGLVGLALQERGVGRRSFASFALLAPLGFACQEHLERLAHTGELPWLLTTPSFLVGLALQVPVALACVAVARRVGLRPAADDRDPLRVRIALRRRTAQLRQQLGIALIRLTRIVFACRCVESGELPEIHGARIAQSCDHFPREREIGLGAA